MSGTPIEPEHAFGTTPGVKRAAEAKASVQAAATESRDQLRQRIDQAQVDANLAMKDAQQQAGEAASRGRSVSAGGGACDLTRFWRRRLPLLRFRPD